MVDSSTDCQETKQAQTQMSPNIENEDYMIFQKTPRNKCLCVLSN